MGPLAVIGDDDSRIVDADLVAVLVLRILQGALLAGPADALLRLLGTGAPVLDQVVVLGLEVVGEDQAAFLEARFGGFEEREHLYLALARLRLFRVFLFLVVFFRRIILRKGGGNRRTESPPEDADADGKPVHHEPRLSSGDVVGLLPRDCRWGKW